MTAYDLMIEINQQWIIEGALSEEQIDSALEIFLSRANTGARAQDTLFDIRTHRRDSSDARWSDLYPQFFIPPRRAGEKLRTLTHQLPNTNILSANAYELEILRLLHLMAPDYPVVRHMVDETLSRLSRVCFGSYDDGMGECFETSIVTLRFLSATRPDDYAWMQSRIDNFRAHVHDRPRSKRAIFYYWLCLSEIPLPLAQADIEHYSADILAQLEKSYWVTTARDMRIRQMLLCVFRNALARLPEYAYLKDRRPAIVPATGKLVLDTLPLLL